MEQIVFYSFAALAVATAMLVVLQRRAVYGALCLIICFVALAVLFFQLGAQFIAAVQVIVYAGAIMVLFLFVIMLLDPESELFSASPVKKAAFMALPLALLLGWTVIHAFPEYGASVRPLDELGKPSMGTIQAIARPLFTEYVIPFELTSILILVAVVGAVVLAKRSD